MVRSTSSVRPISGSILPSWASWLRLVVYLSSALPPSPSRSLSRAGLFLGGLLLGDLRQAVRDEIDHVEARDLGAVQQVHRVALLLAEDGDEHVGDADFLLAGGLHVEHGALQYALEAQRRLHLAVFVVGQARRGAIEVFVERVLELVEVGAAGPQDLAHLGGVEDGEQQVLDRQELVTGLTRLGKGLVQTEFEFLG